MVLQYYIKSIGVSMMTILCHDATLLMFTNFLFLFQFWNLWISIVATARHAILNPFIQISFIHVYNRSIGLKRWFCMMCTTMVRDMVRSKKKLHCFISLILQTSRTTFFIQNLFFLLQSDIVNCTKFLYSLSYEHYRYTCISNNILMHAECTMQPFLPPNSMPVWTT